jgi:P27 family predicted phage terminase small subunit
MPSWLPRLARRKWKVLIPQLHALGKLEKIDADSIANYCTLHASVIEHQRVLERDGETIEVVVRDKHGNEVGKRLRPHPAVAMRHEAMKLMLALGREFGLTSSSRTRLQITEPRVLTPKDVAEQEELKRFEQYMARQNRS